MFKQFFATKDRKVIWHAARRNGKSFTLCAVSLAVCYSKPRSQVRYATFTNKALKKMIFPILREILNNIPPKYQPTFNVQDSIYTFPNGSQIHLAGVDNGNSDSLRGTAADLCVVDEAAFLSDLSYIVESVLMPQLLTVPNGKLLMASSSPLSPAHEFVDYIAKAKQDGTYSSYTIYDAGYDDKLIEEFCKEAGGKSSTTWRREYLNELVVDDSMSIVPEWKDIYSYIPQKSNYDKHYHRYESMDLGVRDKTAVLFATYMFDRAQLYVEREWSCAGQESTTRNIAENIKRIEKELGYNSVYSRVADNNALITLQDLNNEFGLYFGATSKDSLAAMVNEVRLWVDSGRLVIDPCCTELLGCLKYGVYQDDKRKEFGRSKVYGHYDMLASLVYLIRNVDQHTNPIPKGYDHGRQFVVYQDDNVDILKLFNIDN